MLAATGAAQVPGWCAGQPWVGPITAVDVSRTERDLALLASGDDLLARPRRPTGEPGGAASPIGAAVPHGLQTPGLQEQRALASNGWAIGADKSQTGRGMLLANPHFPWEGELRFWEWQ